MINTYFVILKSHDGIILSPVWTDVDLSQCKTASEIEWEIRKQAADYTSYKPYELKIYAIALISSRA